MDAWIKLPCATKGLLLEMSPNETDWLCVTQVAEIISDVREPIMEASQLVDENERRRQQVQVGNTESTLKQLDRFQLPLHIGILLFLLFPHYYSLVEKLKLLQGYRKTDIDTNGYSSFPYYEWLNY